MEHRLWRRVGPILKLQVMPLKILFDGFEPEHGYYHLTMEVKLLLLLARCVVGRWGQHEARAPERDQTGSRSASRPYRSVHDTDRPRLAN